MKKPSLIFVASENMNKIMQLIFLLMANTYLISQEITFINQDEISSFSLIDDTETELEQSLFVRVEGGYAFGEFIGLKHNYGELGLFSALKTNDQRYFISDIRGYLLDNGNWASSLGFGARFQNEDSARIIGANLYYDFRETRFSDFHRVGFGLESLGECFDFRINGYLPVNGNTKKSHNHRFNYGDNFLLSYQQKEYVFKGLDAEVGCYLYRLCNFSLYGAAGPYYYNHKKSDEIFGGQARVELNWKNFVGLRVSVSHDNKFHTQAQGKVMVSFPLSDLFYCGCSNILNSCQNNFIRPVERNNIMFTKHSCDYKWNW